MPLDEPYLAGIQIYPVKSLDPAALRETVVLPGGALAHDREFALLDAEGKYVNAKRHAQIHLLRLEWEADRETVCLHVEGAVRPFRFSPIADRQPMEEWCSRFFDQAVTVSRNSNGGFPDDPQAPGPTVISTATLEEVAGWFPGLTLEETRRRFRANLEIGGVPPFWEDRLFGEAGEIVPFQIGDVRFEGINPCQRCIVPTRDTHTAVQDAEFAQVFRAKREETLPPWANRSRFNHFYRLAINTCIPASESGKILCLGDSVITHRD